MKMSEKIIYQRKKQGISQEELADKIDVSRQAVSRWESGAALPDAVNILKLSKLFNVTADYLLDDEYNENINHFSKSKKINLSKICGILFAVLGFAGNFVIYILSRFNKVMVPVISYDASGEKWYTWKGDITGYSYKYFIQEYNLEFLTVVFSLFIILGLFTAFADIEKIKNTVILKINKIK